MLTQIVSRIERYIDRFVTLADTQYRLPIALWIIGTFCYPEFDAYPYMVITSPTKRSGKTRLAELISFTCSNPRNFAAMTGPTMFRSIESENPTLIVDEAEKLGAKGATDFHAILNVGYRKGQSIPRTVGNEIKEFNTYCPKIFILIGDVYDTLRDRSMIITMRRAEPQERFVYQPVKDEGAAMREEISAAVNANLAALQQAFLEFRGLPFLMDRDEEIWTSIFSVASVFCPERLQELQVCAVDMATEKTQESRRHVDIADQEERDATSHEYAKRLLLDLYSVFAGQGHFVSTVTAIDSLKAISIAPWRKFRGKGITPHDMGNLLSRFGVRAVVGATGSSRGKQNFKRGYKLKDVERAVRELGA